MLSRRALLGVGPLLLPAAARGAGLPLPEARPVPPVQALPLPDDQVSFQAEGRELTRAHFGPDHRRPFLYPVIGPSGRSLTRMGHPHAPVSHSHHNSVWVAHHDVNGESFWADTGPCRIVHQWIVRLTDGKDEAGLVTVNHWVGSGGRVHLVERRGIAARLLGGGEWLLLLDLHLEAHREPATLGKTSFGPAAVRMAKTLGVHDGGGRIRNSEGNVNEQGPNGVFWKPARWVDYSGPIAPGAVEGLALFDHPGNPTHPCPYHVRDDGWMGATVTFAGPRTIPPGTPLRLRYGLYVHRGMPPPERIDEQWRAFSRLPVPDLPADRK